MAEVQFTIDAPATAEAVTGALIDFSERRPEIWPELDPEMYSVHELHRTSAVVREGQRKPRLWALEEYDWTVPGTVTWTVRESNFCTPGSSMSARVETRSEGGSRVHVTWKRSGVGVKGRLIVGLIYLTRGRPLAKTWTTALAALGSPGRPRGSKPERSGT